MLIVDFNNLTIHYGAQPVLNGATFQVDSGQKLGLTGTNGSGKTSVLRVLLGQERPTSGSVSIAYGARIDYLYDRWFRESDR